MGAAKSAEAPAPVLETPPEAMTTRGRENYMRKLGIQKETRNFQTFHPPARTAEAPAVLEHKAPDPQDMPTPPRDLELKFLDLKVQDDFRVNFLRKLSYEKVWVPQAQRPPKHQTVIIFDWDDTLLCTSFLNLPNKEDKALPPHVERHLRDIEVAGVKLLEMAMRMGQTFIITNAMDGWVEYSAAKWIPGLLEVLQKVDIISARTKFESHFPGEVGQWKIQAFLEVQRRLDSKVITNLISLGDSNFEMDAVHVMGKEFQSALVKTIKFREHPSPEELLKQLELVGQKFEKIIENARNLKIGLERKWVGPAQPGG